MRASRVQFVGLVGIVLAACLAAEAGPRVTKVVPDRQIATDPCLVFVSGSGFTDGTTVTVDGTSLTDVTVINDGLITGTIPAGTPGTKDVVVTDPTGGFTFPGGFEQVGRFATMFDFFVCEATNLRTTADTAVAQMEAVTTNRLEAFHFALSQGNVRVIFDHGKDQLQAIRKSAFDAFRLLHASLKKGFDTIIAQAPRSERSSLRSLAAQLKDEFGDEMDTQKDRVADAYDVQISVLSNAKDAEMIATASKQDALKKLQAILQLLLDEMKKKIAQEEQNGGTADINDSAAKEVLDRAVGTVARVRSKIEEQKGQEKTDLGEDGATICTLICGFDTEEQHQPVHIRGFLDLFRERATREDNSVTRETVVDVVKVLKRLYGSNLAGDPSGPLFTALSDFFQDPNAMTQEDAAAIRDGLNALKAQIPCK